jgi:tetratricopeptide (TPR) repeat protein
MPTVARRAAALLSRTHTYSLLYSALDEYRLIRQQPCILPVEVDPMLDHVDGPSSIYTRDDDLRSQIFQHYEANINRMADIAAAAGTPILLITPVSNTKDCSPFRSQHDDRLTSAEYEQWKRLFQRGQELESQEDPVAAVEAYRQAAEIDQRFAEGFFRLGRTYLTLDRVDDAHLSLERARDEDVCPLRAPRGLVQIVRRVAGRRGTMLVDFDSALRNDSLQKHGYTAVGREYFLDHVHLTIAANRMLALCVLDEMVRAGRAHRNPNWHERDIEELTTRVESRIDSRSHAEALRNLARVLWWAGKRDEAGPLALRALEQIPNDPDALIVAAAHLRMKDRRREALEYFCRALTHRPFDAAAYHFAGVEWFELGELDEAQRHLHEALRLRPDDAELHWQLGEILLASGQRQDAILQYTEALRIAPGYQKAKDGIQRASQFVTGS